MVVVVIVGLVSSDVGESFVVGTDVVVIVIVVSCPAVLLDFEPVLVAIWMVVVYLMFRLL